MKLSDASPVSFGLLWKIGGLLFAAGMLYSRTTAASEQALKDLDSTRKQLEWRIERLEQYLDARQRNGL